MSLPGDEHFTPSLGNAFAHTVSTRVRGRVMVAPQTRSGTPRRWCTEATPPTASNSTTGVPRALGGSLKTFTRCHFGSCRWQRSRPIARAWAFDPHARRSPPLPIWSAGSRRDRCSEWRRSWRRGLDLRAERVSADVSDFALAMAELSRPGGLETSSTESRQRPSESSCAWTLPVDARQHGRLRRRRLSAAQCCQRRTTAPVNSSVSSGSRVGRRPVSA